MVATTTTVPKTGSSSRKASRSGLVAVAPGPIRRRAAIVVMRDSVAGRTAIQGPRAGRPSTLPL